MIGPSSWVFLAIVLNLTVIATAVAAVTWQVRRWRLARRLVATFTIELLVLVSLGAVINVNQQFYTTWPALFGVQDRSEHVQVVVDQSARPTRPGPAPTGSAARTAAIDRTEAGRSRIVNVTLVGRRTGYRLAGVAYVPGSYFHPDQAQRRFPVVMLLTGYPGTPRIWPDRLRLKEVLDRQIRTGRMPAVLAVMPRQDPDHPRDSECVDAVGGARAGTYLGEDVPDAVAARFRVRTDRDGWAVMGYSTGGFCAANLAIGHPRRFSKAISLSGYFTAITDASTGDLYHGDAAARRLNSPLWSVAHRPHAPLTFFVSAAKDHHGDLTAALAFAKAVRAPDGVTVALIATGGHSTAAWQNMAPHAFGWLGQHLTS
ncbi:alpha/beta hydrolase [Fodinicola acaciae]|uniref:alpha/beta hydrolase n=1 Tax=Fodinicola acaciae TaxID=2681555 RepID=UPI0013D67831|nr:alpha/beta hydrolase-fold protein [Fodinicola acaciae]